MNNTDCLLTRNIMIKKLHHTLSSKKHYRVNKHAGIKKQKPSHHTLTEINKTTYIIVQNKTNNTDCLLNRNMVIKDFF